MISFFSYFFDFSINPNPRWNWGSEKMRRDKLGFFGKWFFFQRVVISRRGQFFNFLGLRNIYILRISNEVLLPFFGNKKFLEKIENHWSKVQQPQPFLVVSSDGKLLLRSFYIIYNYMLSIDKIML